MQHQESKRKGKDGDRKEKKELGVREESSKGIEGRSKGGSLYQG